MCLGLVVRPIHEDACAWWKVRVKGYMVRRSLVGRVRIEGACAWWKVRVKGKMVRRSLVGRVRIEGACACGFPVPRNGLLGPMRIIRSRAGVS